MMNIESQTMVIGGILGFAVGILSMTLLNLNKPDHFIEENIIFCEDMIEWMQEDIENGAKEDSFEIYIEELEKWVEFNKELLIFNHRFNQNQPPQYYD